MDPLDIGLKSDKVKGESNLVPILSYKIQSAFVVVLYFVEEKTVKTYYTRKSRLCLFSKEFITHSLGQKCCNVL